MDQSATIQSISLYPVHPVAKILKLVQYDEIRYCPTCCPEKKYKPTTLLNAARMQMSHQRLRDMQRAGVMSEIHPIDPYSRGSFYYNWLINRLDFFGISHIDCESTLSLEKKYAETLDFR